MGRTISTQYAMRGVRNKAHFAEKLGAVMFPFLPDKSPTWHLEGWLGSQGGDSVAPYGSKCAPAEVQLKFETGNSWMWYTVHAYRQRTS